MIALRSEHNANAEARPRLNYIGIVHDRVAEQRAAESLRDRFRAMS